MEDQLHFYALDHELAGSQDFLDQSPAEHARRDAAEVAARQLECDEALAFLGLDLGEDPLVLPLEDLPLFEELGNVWAGVTTGDLEEACNLHIFTSSHERPVVEEEPATKRQRLDGACDDKARLLLPATPATAPEFVSPRGTERKNVDKAHGCLYCAKSFDTKSALSTHERVHTGAKPFSCEDCGKGFSQKCNLQNHLKTHSGVKDYVCHEAGCGKAFSDPSNLKQHLEKTHGGSKAFCDICSKGLRGNFELRRHLNSAPHKRRAGL
ncbi:hypothetical protein T484DRAFT_1977699 [Baffinella frigidus]|jgi:hypothetical protein|nr:hypothetical protein T484DRAFT_1977699 [Cryptophyta sp. CCMP2293]